MELARKIILHSPVSDAAQLKDFVEQCIAQKVSLLAIFGPGATDLEDAIDWIVIGDGSDPSRLLCTTSHTDEPLDDVLNMVAAWERDRGGTVQEVRL